MCDKKKLEEAIKQSNWDNALHLANEISDDLYNQILKVQRLNNLNKDIKKLTKELLVEVEKL